MEYSYADSTTHFSSRPIQLHLVTLTVPSTMSNFITSHAGPDCELQKMLLCQIQALRLEFFSRKPTCGSSCKQALLLSWQQSCTSPTTHAGLQAISIFGWSKTCNDVYSSGYVHVVVPPNVKLKVTSLKTIIFKVKISTTHVAQNISSKAGS